MRILVSNDDGYQAPGIRRLALEMQSLGDVVVVAPDRDRSGASNSLTLDQPIRATMVEPSVYRVEGTPTDCVHLAVTGLLDDDPDMVVSGINAGANMGDDILYSGTVAAATEGRFLGLPAIAISLCSHDPRHLDTAARVALLLVQRLLRDPLPADTILNVNVPDIPWSALRGFEATRLGQRHRAEPAIREMDPRNRPIYWIGPPGSEQDAGEGTDFHAVRNGFVSITPIQIDLTRYEALDKIAGWVTGLS
ncbi:5'-nucleotidase [Natronocella acetinitrilica]|uniref:5'-nucleotidase SurE n=1 Tax=Natronocella acetinitrilica TaxID=414046 RepID=A0AAE3KBW3_9GAMM|nr:5'/3'-nucleotidase SurE [Natronocella acetinitrilica]MCP1676175.1 5'-nucleotidase [Natronocella acetinitrilica]